MQQHQPSHFCYQQPNTYFTVFSVLWCPHHIQSPLLKCLLPQSSGHSETAELLQSNTSSKPALSSTLLTQTKAELNGSSVGFGPPQPAAVEAVTGASGDLLIPFDCVLVASFLLTSLTWERHYQGHVAPQAGSTAVPRKGGGPGQFQLFISLPA